MKTLKKFTVLFLSVHVPGKLFTRALSPATCNLALIKDLAIIEMVVKHMQNVDFRRPRDQEP